MTEQPNPADWERMREEIRTLAATRDWVEMRDRIANLDLPKIHRTKLRCKKNGCGRTCLEAWDSGDGGLWVVNHLDLPHIPDVPGATWEFAVLEALATVDALQQPSTGNRRRDLARLWALKFTLDGLVALAASPKKTGTWVVSRFDHHDPTTAVAGQCLEHHTVENIDLDLLRAAVTRNTATL